MENKIENDIENGINNKIYKRIVLSGGSLKGISYIGVLRHLEELNITKTLEEYIGTSIGALFCLILCIGYTSDDLEKIFMNFDPSTLVDYHLSGLLESFGLDDGKKLESFIKIFIKNKGHKEDITLKQLYEKTDKKMTFSTCHINTKQNVFLNYLTFPELPVYLAVRMSMNIPIIFSPVLYKESLYIDGCMSCNLPVKFLTKESTKEDSVFVVYLKPDNIHKHQQIENIMEYLSTLPKCSVYCIENNDIIYCNEILKCKILFLEIKVKFKIDFSITNSCKKDIIEYGYSEAKNFFINNS